jgi:hypothetical protein
VTPYHPAHSTQVAGLASIKGGDNRFYNNIFVGRGEPAADARKRGKPAEHVAGFGLWVYDAREFPLQTGGNVYHRGAQPYGKEASAASGSDANAEVVEEGDRVFVRVTAPPEWKQANTTLVTTKLLGKALIPKLGYENPDGSPLAVDTDYFGKPRNKTHPTPGPFENPGEGPITLKVW